jgi:hypothetical protein
MEAPATRGTNKRYQETAGVLMDRLFSESTQRGWYGRFWVEVTLQDGVVQSVQEHRERRHRTSAEPPPRT